MTAPSVSVIIPHLNQPDQLWRCLESISQQNYDLKKVEVIVVDNGSRLLPEAVCSRFANVRLLVEDTPGPGPARNRGVAAARSELLAFIDADCLADPNWLGAAVKALEDPVVAVVGGEVRIAYEDPQKLTGLEAYESVFAYRQKEYIEKKGFSGTGNLATRLQVIKAVGPFGGIDIAEDRDWGNRAKKLNFKIAYAPDMIVRHPARKTFRELTEKWDRHTSHEFQVRANGELGKLKWLLLATLVATSSVIDTYKIFLSDRLDPSSSILQACGVLIKIRLHRAIYMLRLMFGNGNVQGSRNWNRIGDLD